MIKEKIICDTKIFRVKVLSDFLEFKASEIIYVVRATVLDLSDYYLLVIIPNLKYWEYRWYAPCLKDFFNLNCQYLNNGIGFTPKIFNEIMKDRGVKIINDKKFIISEFI